MQPELPVGQLDLRRFNQMGMPDPNADKRSFKRLLPELQELPQDREGRCHIVILPDEGLDEMRVVGVAVEDFGRRQSIAGELPNKIPGDLNVFRHGLSHFLAKGGLAAGGSICLFHARSH
jgi:hypothetical protein